MTLTERQTVQEDEYEIPYHYLAVSHRLLALPDKIIATPIYLNYLKTVMDELRPFRGQRILEAGCGDGRFLYELRKETDNAILHGIDYSARAISFARVFNPGVALSVADLTKDLPFDDGYFDQVVLIETIEHIPPESLSHALTEVARILKSGGRVVISVPHVNRKLDEKHYQHFDSNSLKRAIEPHFSVQDIRGYHNNSKAKNAMFLATIAIYYYLYPIRIPIVKKVSDCISRMGNGFFKNYLETCAVDGGNSLICVARKDSG